MALVRASLARRSARERTTRAAAPSVICIGAGPAGLTAAYVLGKSHVHVAVLEQDPKYVGGISRTATYKGFAFDIGGHRFFSKSAAVNELWTELLGNDFLERPRKSRIYYHGNLFAYPLRAPDALAKLGALEAARCVASYLKARAVPGPTPRTFEQWVTARFGRRLFQIFFKTYTEKVWGMKCSEISADWAAQRIRGLSLPSAVWNSLTASHRRSPRAKVIKTLIDRFRYPRRGPGMLWDEAARRIGQQGNRVLLGRHVTRLQWRESGEWAVTTTDAAGIEQTFSSEYVVSSMPLRDLVPAIAPKVSSEVLSAAGGLRYRDFLTVALIVRDRQVFDDNWIYVHDPGIKVGRIQNFKSWSPDMVPDPDLNCYGLEYFCFEDDGLWASADKDLIQLATDELVTLGLAVRDDVIDGTVVRQAKAYPVYDEGYQNRVSVIRRELETRFPTLQVVGRNGMHKYNNQDHAMMTAMLAAQNILLGQRQLDVWRVNQDAEYHEEGAARTGYSMLDHAASGAGGERIVPMAVRSAVRE